jgi:D-alanyl-lipoteichoic acid acyltransferase DltB (MBOAT superfamily)
VIFTSYTYALFLLAAFVIHWSIPRSWRKAFLIAASYVFYASWDWRFAFLLLGVSLFNWAYAERVLAREDPGLLWPGVVVNLLPLIVFKYSGFFYENVAGLANVAGADLAPRLPWTILLPLGISFFTFQGIAYLIDVATGERPMRLVDFLLFKALWPQLIAGPIIRAGEIREQIEGERLISYDDWSYGCRRLLAGAFKKVVLADNLAPVVDTVFRATAVGAVDAAAALLGFALQIYFDFSAYSDMAIGSARLFGFRFPENFDWPYLSRSPREFWTRWHMTLSRWIRDYVFTPLTFAMRGNVTASRFGLIAVMALVGLWHGAAWTFVLWGVWHGVLLAVNDVVARRLGPPHPAFGHLLPKGEGTRDDGGREPSPASVGEGAPERSKGADEGVSWMTLFTFALVTLGWLLFRSATVAQAVDLLEAIVTMRGGGRPSVLRVNGILIVFVYFLGLMAAQLARPRIEHFMNATADGSMGLRILRPIVYAVAILSVIIFGQEAQSFVYFQF